MTDTDPRLEAVAEAIYDSERYPEQPSWDETFYKNRDRCRHYARAALDALRAFDQAPDSDPRCPNCRGITEHLAWCPYGPRQPESEAPQGHCSDCRTSYQCSQFGCFAKPRKEVMPHRPARHISEARVSNDKAPAPVMGADPPEPPWFQELWLDLVEKDDRTSPEEYPDHALITREELLGYVRFANAQPPTVAEILVRPRSAWPDPTPEMQASSLFEAIWSVIKTWDIAVPKAYSGYCGATGNHVRAILDAINARPPSESEIDAAHRTYLESESDDTFEVMRVALVAAYKARSGA